MFAHHLDDNNNLAAIMMLVAVQIKFVQFRYNTFYLFVFCYVPETSKNNADVTCDEEFLNCSKLCILLL